VAVFGSKTPMVFRPSPFQSPSTGIQWAEPYWIGVTVGGPAVKLVRKYHVAVLGSNTPTPGA